MVRQVHRAVTSISSPFKEPEDFKAHLKIEPPTDWLDDLLDLETVLDYALYEATCLIEDGSVTYDYEFRPLPGMDRVDGRKIKSKVIPAHGLVDLFNQDVSGSLGPILFDVRIFDLDQAVLRMIPGETKGIREFLKINGGVRVYRDRIRVFDYGAPGNDWLGLGGRRVNVPARRLSNNLMVGAVHIDGDLSPGLVEKTNREGFVENESYELFCALVGHALQQIETERNQDKDRIRNAYALKKLREPVLDAIDELRGALQKRHLEKELGPFVDSIESQFKEIREVLLSAAGSGLTMQVVVHEIEKGVKQLNLAIKRGGATDRVKDLAIHLGELMDSLAYLGRKSPNRQETASAMIRSAIFNSEYRFDAHKIKCFDGTKAGHPDFEVTCSRRLVIATLMNLIDNSIYWLGNKGGRDKRILVGTTEDLPGGKALFVADNGPGFADSPHDLVKPFVTRKPDGMGLGLYIASEVMQSQGGRLVFPDKGMIELPNGYDGAVVALQFKEK